MNNSNELAKLHCLHSLFGPTVGNDLFLTCQIKSAIEYYLTGSHLSRSSIQKFSQTVPALLKSPVLNANSSAFCFLDLSEQDYDPLWVRKWVLDSFKELAGYRHAVLLVTGLRSCLCPNRKYWTQRIAFRYTNAIRYIDELAASSTTRKTKLQIVHV